LAVTRTTFLLVAVALASSDPALADDPSRVAAEAAPLSEPGSPVEVAEWTGLAAIPLTRHHGSLALVGESRFGIGHDVQIGTHAMGVLAPHASLLWRFAHRGRWNAAGRLGFAYPYPMMRVLTGHGTGALLPVDREPSQAVMLDLAARLTMEIGRGQLVTLESALVVAPRFTNADSAPLDFPFLYPRFAALEAPLVARFRGTGEGIVHGPFRWVASLEYWQLPVTHGGFALEERAALAWVARRRATLELGGRGSYARYPVGLRFHVTPYFDVRVRW